MQHKLTTHVSHNYEILQANLGAFKRRQGLPLFYEGWRGGDLPPPPIRIQIAQKRRSFMTIPYKFVNNI